MGDKVVLHFNLKNTYVREQNELVRLRNEDFKYEVPNDENLTTEELKDKYWDEAARAALYQEMVEFADFIVK